jgi:hypothetical protein
MNRAGAHLRRHAGHRRCASMRPTPQQASCGGAIGAAGGAVLRAITGGSPALGLPLVGPLRRGLGR